MSASSKATTSARGKVDVVVTEGFAGNIALKTAEGTARQIGDYLRAAMSRTLAAADRLSARARPPSQQAARHSMDPRKANGGVFLGLNGIVIKSHGGTDAEGFAAAIDLGYDMVRDELLAKITAALGRHAGDEAATGAERSRFVTVRVRSFSAAAAICRATS